MNMQMTRRDFLKLAGLLPLSVVNTALGNWLKPYGHPQVQSQNVIIVVFDALTARNISLYGYPRDTMPNLSRLAEKAVVYHNHYAGGNFTTPGTASLLTGVLPWTHRAFQHNGKVEASFIGKNMFTAFSNYFRLAYSHNAWANTLLVQFKDKMERYLPKQKFFLTNDGFISSLFEKDEDIASVSWVRLMKRVEEGFSYSLFLSHLYEPVRNAYWNRRVNLDEIKSSYPYCVPGYGTDDFLLEEAIDSITEMLTSTPQPFAGYFHFWPPHEPYCTHKDFYRRFFKDGYQAMSKPLDQFGLESNREGADKQRTLYDEFILYVDREFGRFYERLQVSGLLENTWLVFTSDHGEMFERGIIGHRTPVLYQPVVHIPLLIFEPGRKTRKDIWEPTSAVDVLPTLLHLTGQPVANWVEGAVLPPYSQTLPDERSLFVVHAEKNEQFAPLTQATIAMFQGRYKLIYFFGYDELGSEGKRIELYDVDSDPEELINLYPKEKELGSRLLRELKAKLDEVNAPYLT